MFPRTVIKMDAQNIKSLVEQTIKNKQQTIKTMKKLDFIMKYASLSVVVSFSLN